jgi:hypothetical protein
VDDEDEDDEDEDDDDDEYGGDVDESDSLLLRIFPFKIALLFGKRVSGGGGGGGGVLREILVSIKF